jgi:hypothetical protein
LVERPEGKEPFGIPKIDEKMILKWIFRKQNQMLGPNSCGSG